jgi:hypothetical protein
MRFSVSSLSSLSSVISGERAAWRGRQEQFLCGGLLLVMAGWVTSHPPPKAPKLPSACRERLQNVLPAPMEGVSEQQPPVWVDTRSGIFYFTFDKCYGRTPGGKYLTMEKARAQGYRSSARVGNG